MSNVLITGATGFVGRRLVQTLELDDKLNVTAVARSSIKFKFARNFQISSLDKHLEWSAALKGQKVVIHTAGRAHINNDKSSNPMVEYRKINVNGTINLAKIAASAGVKRFIFISSIKVNGEKTILGNKFKAEDKPNPTDFYSISKLEAEKGLHKISQKTGMEVVIIRPPLVYGFGVKGNFANLIKLIKKGLPLPFGAIYNQRSLISLDNLINLISKCINNPKASNQLFLAGDGQDISTSQLFQKVAAAAGKKSFLIPVPVSFLIYSASLLGKKPLAYRLIDSLQIDISKTRNLLNWEPPVSVDEGLRRCFIKD
jgi:nucleoside-diphosphate-sugar epimerase